MSSIRKSINLAFKFVFLLSIFLFFLPPAAYATHEDTEINDEDKIFDTFTVYWENDFIARTDSDYTNGLKFTWSTPYDIDNGKNHLPDWSYSLLNSLPFVNDSSSHRAVSLSLGQMIYTPEDTDRSDLIVDDRPYAGYLYLASGFHNRTRNRKNSWEFKLGIVGPLAFGEETQDFIHSLMGSSKAEGWDHQLGNEVAFEIICESQWRVYQSPIRSGFNYDLIPHMGFRVGNVQTYVNTGFEIRYGWSLPRDFGSCPIRAGCATNSAFNSTPSANLSSGLRSWHIFAAVDGRAVAHDIFLDGSTFRDSHSVERKVLVADMMAGLAVDFGNFAITYSYVLRTKQFATENDNHFFGSLNLSWTY